ncbi:hypothetical protein TNCV_4384191 [Trichonephila clavipes]|nr:hypothetical protein TNCV_4384191 [Trichonephila clavipes]
MYRQLRVTAKLTLTEDADCPSPVHVITFSSRSCDRRLCGKNHHTYKDIFSTLNYSVVPARIARRPLKSRGSLSPLLAGCNEMLKKAPPPDSRTERGRVKGKIL